MNQLDVLLGEYASVTNDLQSMEQRKQEIRDKIYGEVTNSGMDRYQNNDFTVVKTQETTLTSITKGQFYSAVEQADISEEAKQRLIHDTLRVTSRQSTVIISPR